ncbi:MAG TPA: lipid IV(A) 3-deoxy-D-manno-octulosonic acid transferase [Arenimonas sp.]|nr:lipid IV(A) 3-deoxy-D-manno-octulosonic acid transferase [Arenimonas sp.]
MTTYSYTIISRLFYAGLWCCALPLYLLYFLYRSLRQADYRKHLSERFVFASKNVQAPIWLHAASLGEVKAAAPLLAELQLSHPEIAILISCQTPAGRKAAQALPLSNKVVVYLPFDMAIFTRRFFRIYKPSVALIFETEIWPNLFLSARQAGVPLLMINARITERSVRRYAKLGTLIAQALKLPNAIVCQTQADADRLIEAGALPEVVSVSGNIKWDIGQQLAKNDEALYQRHPVWIAASTHELEEQFVIEMHRKVLQQWPAALLLWAPRHPERFDSVYLSAVKSGLNIQRRSQHTLPNQDCQVFLIDTLGELVQFLSGANVVFVGGSLQNIGGHNVLEPASLGLPVIVGPHTQNFAEVIENLKQAGALLQVADAVQLQTELLDLLCNPERANRMGQNALHCVMQNKGALQKTKALIDQRL